MFNIELNISSPFEEEIIVFECRDDDDDVWSLVLGQLSITLPPPPPPPAESSLRCLLHVIYNRYQFPEGKK
ncbi:hypothetical protein DERP_013007 [Dermatophagoides pteronyssinus]|uniref:Uncharacterized protein n=1 Tax=Dermatophagoides pteronyssinus TaxID=6956 RepID=A0ABQ8JQL1_DERPT|nr:hypothetical protein DERP_013007 [Dermatophagoides pteronyssinus]